jgi:hypothetical protein
MARCLRCGAGNEWIEGRVPDETLSRRAARVCEWTEIQADSDIYNTCVEGQEFHLTPGYELYPFCHWCGGKIVVVDDSANDGDQK